MTAAMGSIRRDREMHDTLAGIMAERAQLLARVHELTIERDLARQMLRPHVPVEVLDQALPAAF